MRQKVWKEEIVEVNSDVITWFSEGDLCCNIAKCYRREVPWFWYRNVLAQAEQRGFVRIVGHSEELPLWWRPFDEAVEVLSEKLAVVLREESSWNGQVVSV